VNEKTRAMVPCGASKRAMTIMAGEAPRKDQIDAICWLSRRLVPRAPKPSIREPKRI